LAAAFVFAAASASAQDALLLPPPIEAEAWEIVLEVAPEVAEAASTLEQLIEQVNLRRLDCDDPSYACSVTCPAQGLPPLKRQWRLERAAQGHSASMALNDFFSHYDPTVGCVSPGTRVDAAGYDWTSLAENIYAGSSSPTGAVDAWMASSPHCSAILSSARREIGGGYFGQAGDQPNVEIDRDNDCNCADESPPPPNPCAGGPYVNYWTLDFANRGGTVAFPLVIEREAYQTSSTLVDLYLYDAGGSSKQMRFSDDGEIWSGLAAYSATSSWVLPSGDGVKVVYSEFQSTAGTFRSCDRIVLESGGADSSTIFRESFECGDESLGLWDLVSP